MQERKINLRSFLDAAFGFTDSESGYGACYPRSRDLVAFFSGRIDLLPTSGAITTRYDRKDSKNRTEFQGPWVESAELLAEDLIELSRQIYELLPPLEQCDGDHPGLRRCDDPNCWHGGDDEG